MSLRRCLAAVSLAVAVAIPAAPARAQDRIVIVFPLRSTPELAPRAADVTRELLAQIGSMDGYAARLIPAPTKGTLGDAAGKAGADTYVSGDLTQHDGELDVRIGAFASTSDLSQGEYDARLNRFGSLPAAPGAGMLFGVAEAPNARLHAVVHRNAILVPSGVAVPVALDAPVSSEIAKAGDAFTFKAVAPVAIDGYVVVRKGAEGRGVVALVERASGNGHPGRLGLRFDTIAGVDGHDIALCSALKDESGEQKAGMSSTATIVSYLAIGPMGIFAHDFVHGRQITVDDTTVLKAYVDHTVSAAFVR